MVRRLVKQFGVCLLLSLAAFSTCRTRFSSIASLPYTSEKLALLLTPEILARSAKKATETKRHLEAVVLLESDGKNGKFKGAAFVEVARDGSVVLEIKDQNLQVVATHRYRPLGKDILFIDGTEVTAVGEREKGINRAAYELMLSLHPGTQFLKCTLTMDNERIYHEKIGAGLSPEAAVKETPAFRKSKDHFDLDLAHSVLPRKKTDEITLVLQRRR